MPSQLHSPKRIVVEGIDGVGKSTVIAILQRLLAHESSVLVETMAPITLGLMKDFGQDTLGAQQAYWTAVSRRTKTQVFLTEGVTRAEYLKDYYATFDVVIYDRWWQTFRAYSDDAADFDHRCDFLRKQLPEVDIVFWVVGDTSVCAERLVRDDDWLTKQMPAQQLPGFLNRLQEEYVEIFADDSTCVVIDAGDRHPEDLAIEMFEQVTALLSGATSVQTRSAGTYRSEYSTYPGAAEGAIVAIEGVDGAGKSTLAQSVAAALPGRAELRRLASASLAMFKGNAKEGSEEDPSVALRRTFEDEFRHQTYLVDGLVQLACIRAEGTAASIQIFDRWFPTFAIYQDRITSDRPVFDYLLSRYPKPETLFYLELPANVALDRLTARGDWMLDALGAAGSRDALLWMIDQHRPTLERYEGTLSILNGEASQADLVDSVVAEVSR